MRISGDHLGKITVTPSWLPIEDGLHPFQDRMVDITTWEHDTLIVDAPTGSGKTYGFIELAKRNLDKGEYDGLLIVEPTRKLCRQVYDDFVYEGFEPEIIDAEHISNKQKEGENRYRTIQRIFNQASGDVVITNPVQISMILHNFYKGSKEERLFELRRNFSLVTIDEWHAYNWDQSAHLLALHNLLSVTNDVKFIYASATPPRQCEDILESAGIDCETLHVDLEDDGKGKRKVRGEVELNLNDGNCLSWVRENVDYLSEGRWILIFDKIKDLSKAHELLSQEYPGECYPLSGFHRTTDKYLAPEHYKWEHRIVLTTNILELGTNPPSKGDRVYRNLVMDPGFSWKNTIQRFGRIGRNGMDAEVKLCKEGVIELYPPRGVKKLLKLDEIKYQHFQQWCMDADDNQRLEPVSGVRVGIQIGVILEQFEDWTVRKLLNDMIEDEELKRGMGLVWKARKAVNDFPQNDYAEDIESLDKWWDDYMESLTYFIKPSQEEKVEFYDAGDVLEAKIDSAWKEEYMKDDANGVYNFRADERRDFPVRVKGIPFREEEKIRYDKYKYQGRELIIENFKNIMNNTSGLSAMLTDDNPIDDLENGLDGLINLTASKNRLIVTEVLNATEERLL